MEPVDPLEASLRSCKEFNIRNIDEKSIRGWINSEDLLDKVIEVHERSSLTSFVSWHNDKTHRQKVLKSPRVLWKFMEIPDDGVSFIVGHTEIKKCQYGKAHKRTGSETSSQAGDHSYQAKRRHIQLSRKVGCPATIHIRHVMRYEHFSVPVNSTKEKKRETVDHLRECLKEGSAQPNLRIWISLPRHTAHENHDVTAESGLAHRVDARVQGKVYELVGDGIISVPLIKKFLKRYVEKELCVGEMMPSAYDRRYYPTNRDISNHVHRALIAGRYANLDQEDLELKCMAWKEKDPSSFYFLRKATEPDNRESLDEGQEQDNDEGDVPNITNRAGRFLFVHQEEWQKRLLLRYGNDLCLLDATYKVTKYALPLFLLCVRTNVDYVPVAEFIVEDECTASITEALHILKEQNDTWQPNYFMVDYSEAELLAITTVFPKAKVYLCAFHREQAWDRWSKKSAHGLSADHRQMFLDLMRDIANAADQNDYRNAVESLRSSHLYRKNKNLRAYVEQKWLKISERWSRAFLHHGFGIRVRTNNGVESLNKSLKHFYLKLSSTGTLSSLVTTLVQEFLPARLHNYIFENWRASSQNKQYDHTRVPSYLQNRPYDVVQHCIKSLTACSLDYTEQDVVRVPDPNDAGPTFQVKSMSGKGNWYMVSLGSDTKPPSCQCEHFQRYLLPCKHIFATFLLPDIEWESLCPLYRNSVYLTLDGTFLSDLALRGKVGAIDDAAIHHEGEESEVTAGNDEVETTTPQGRSLTSLQKELRICLKQAEDASFLCCSEEKTEQALVFTKQALDTLKAGFEEEGGLTLHHQETVLRPIPGKRKGRKRIPPKRSAKVCQKGSSSKIPPVNENLLSPGLTAHPGEKVVRQLRKRKSKKEVHAKSSSTVSGMRKCNVKEPDPTPPVENALLGVPAKKQKIERAERRKTSSNKKKNIQRDITEMLHRQVYLSKQRVQEDAKEPGTTRSILTQGTKQTSIKQSGSGKHVQFAPSVKSASVPDGGAQPYGGLLNRPGQNLCFANSVLQCLRVTEIHRILQRHATGLDCHKMDCFACQLWAFFEEGPPSATKVTTGLKGVWHEYEPGKQQDAHEFLEKLLQEVDRTCEIATDDSYNDNVRLFFGELMNTLTCKGCGKASVTSEKFRDLSLSIVKAETLDAAVKDFFAPESIDYRCDRCKKRTTALKQVHLHSLQKNLIIHLKRFDESGRKLDKDVKIDNVLSLKKYIGDQTKEPEYKYSLFGVVVHTGRSTGGHYFSHIQFGCDWYKIDDMRVMKERWEDVLKDKGYLLFYRRLPRPYIERGNLSW